MPLAWDAGRGHSWPTFGAQREQAEAPEAPTTPRAKRTITVLPRRWEETPWPSGRRWLNHANRLGHWQDGQPLGKGFPQPCLQPEYARLIARGRKTVEGRPGGGWLTTLPQPNDYINFQVNGGNPVG